MSNTSPLLSLPYIQEAQAQKHVTHNEALRILDSIVQPAVMRSDLVEPPSAVQNGDRYIVPAGALGDWQGHAHALAIRNENHWRFHTPQPGWIVWDLNASSALVFQNGVWEPTNPTVEKVDIWGVNADPDITNRFSVSGAASLFIHEGTDHRLKINKASSPDTASLLFQSNWDGCAELGLLGDNDFRIRVSDGGNEFTTAFHVDAQTGAVSFPAGVSGLSDPDFGSGPYLTSAYSTAKGQDLVTNGTGLLANNYNFPEEFTFDGTRTPNLPGAFRFAGYGPNYYELTEYLGVDPNVCYEASFYVMQEPATGDWSAFAEQDRHRQFVGLACFDIDQQEIKAQHHMRYKSAGIDSLTTLAAPLSPGDMTITLADASGWNDTDTPFYQRGVVIFGYKNNLGAVYDYYSRFVQFDLFDLAGVDKATNVITLKTPFPSSLGNPGDPGGTWPVGTSLANSTSGGTYKYSVFPGMTLAETNKWYHVKNHIGGIDTSGENVTANFSPGTAYVKMFWLPNFSNRPGGDGGYPDTGSEHGVLYSGISVTKAPLSALQKMPNGKVSIKVASMDFSSGEVSLLPQGLQVTAL